VTSKLTIARGRKQADLLLPTVCKVRSSNNGCNSLFKLLPRKDEPSYFMVVRIHTKRKIFYQIFLNFYKKRRASLLLQAVERMKWNQRNVWLMAE
jgi:hypothetical protein